MHLLKHTSASIALINALSVMETFNVNIRTFMRDGKKIISTGHSFKLTVQLCRTQNAIHVKNNTYM